MITRRTVLQTAALGATAKLLIADDAPFTLPKLPYAYDALEPYIDAQTMQIHHDKHHKAYVDNLNKAIGPDPVLSKLSVEELLQKLDTLPASVRTQVRNQGGGHANHSLFWPSLAPAGQSGKPEGKLAEALKTTFGEQEKFEDSMRKAALSVFGSGWAWLTFDQGNGKLAIETTPNQDSPLSAGRQPLLGIDVWEHAYYLKYQNRRPDYVTAFIHVVNWGSISDRFSKLSS